MNKTCWYKFKNFKEEEFKCKCGKCKTEVGMNCSLIYALQTVRNYLGVPVTVSCGMRCQEFNDSLAGSIKNSDHLVGDAADFYFSGSNELEKRRDVMYLLCKLPNVKYCYCNGSYMTPSTEKRKYNAPWMGSAIHVSVK